MIRLTFILASLAVAVVPTQVSAEDAGCNPTYLVLSAESLVVRFDPIWEVEFNGILVGCQADLARIDASALDDVRGRLEALAREKHFNLYRKAGEPEFRREVCKELNEALGQDLVSDIYFHKLALTEYRPEEPRADS